MPLFTLFHCNLECELEILYVSAQYNLNFCEAEIDPVLPYKRQVKVKLSLCF